MPAAADLRRYAARIRTLPETVVRAGAAEISRSILATLDADTGDRILSGTVGRRGRRIKLGVTTRVTGGAALATATVAASPPRARAPWAWLEAGTGPRTVGRLTRKRDGAGGKHLNAGDGWFTGPVTVGPMGAKHTFTRGVRAGTIPAEEAMAAAFARAAR